MSLEFLVAPASIEEGQKYLVGRIPSLDELACVFHDTGHVYQECMINECDVSGYVNVLFPDGDCGNYMSLHLSDIDLKQIPDAWSTHPKSEVDRIACAKAVAHAKVIDETIIIDSDEDSDE